jgi:hypothetical protein
MFPDISIFLASGVVALVVGLITSALQIMGYINVNAARIMLFLAWLVGVVGACASLNSPPLLHLVITATITGVPLAAGLIALERHAVRNTLKALPEGKVKPREITVTDEERRLAKMFGDSRGLGTPPQANRNLEIARRLNDYLEQGQTILRKAENSSVTDTSLLWWEMEVKTYLEESLGEYAAIDFTKGYPETPYPHAAVNRHLVNRLYTQLQTLGRLIEEQRRG